MANDESSNGDQVHAENYHQHAEHYTRLLNASRDRSSRDVSPNSDSFISDDGGNGRNGGKDQPARAAPAATASDRNGERRPSRHPNNTRRRLERNPEPVSTVESLPSFLTEQPNKAEQPKPAKREGFRRTKPPARISVT